MNTQLEQQNDKEQNKKQEILLYLTNIIIETYSFISKYIAEYYRDNNNSKLHYSHSGILNLKKELVL